METTLYRDRRARLRDHARQLVLIFDGCIAEFLATRAQHHRLFMESLDMLVPMLRGHDFFLPQ